MKSLKSLVLLVIISALAASNAFAKDAKKTHKHTEDADEVTSEQAAPSAHSGGHMFGFGFMTAGTFNAGSALAMELNISSTDNIQPFLGITTTNNFQWGLGAIYRHTIVHGENAGLHVGGALGLGTSGNVAPTQGNANLHTAFNAAVGPTGGMHFHFPSVPNIEVFLDGGAMIQINDGTANFFLQSLSPFAGLSIAYLL